MLDGMKEAEKSLMKQLIYYYYMYAYNIYAIAYNNNILNAIILCI